MILSSALIFLLLRENKGLVLLIFKKPLKENNVDVFIDKETIEKTTKCASAFKCLTDETHSLCATESIIKEYGLFVNNKANNNSCAYKMSFGNGTICKCPTRYEIFERYKR